MILVTTSRAVLGQPAWAYRDFEDENEAADWILDNDAELGVGHVYEFLGGKLVREIPAMEWGSWCDELRASAAADRKHTLLWGRPGL